jgi:hypothetical protein
MENERVTAMKKLGFKDFRNGTQHTFEDISSEQSREYVFPDCVVKIDEPVALNVNYSSGGHRVFDANGTSHYIPSGWRELKWTVNPDKPHFVK